ncbi:hypothetical protein [Eggerthella sinensis]|uniref:hypothetical protein n=1 Tax=Eggerthella sinensis TaxID=242230 RepID=UPI001D075C0F|nr:hypothetical protein [Eggerthella sinensis]MCB7036680.1 hypothetical protein [Eggerthella sinensis]
MLKGWRSVLARTAKARATRDIDLLAEQADLDRSLAELKALAAMDLGDFMTFEFVRAEPTETEDEYRSGLKVSFTPLLASSTPLFPGKQMGSDGIIRAFAGGGRDRRPAWRWSSVKRL